MTERNCAGIWKVEELKIAEKNKTGSNIKSMYLGVGTKTMTDRVFYYSVVFIFLSQLYYGVAS